ncbi:MAG TPA: protein-disulfide reductase DsbD domain-containing protein, partial [Opitutus sp.]|nr:protein-disulfide reductase DsbD domain-containing protein [Opitutus sp.]
LYSSDFKADIGPLPTAFTFEPSSGAAPVGEVRAINPKRKKDRTWDTEFTYFENTAEFRQPLRVAKSGFTLRGTIKGQLCNERDGTCSLFEQPLEITASTDRS